MNRSQFCKEEDDENELKDIKHLTKAMMVEATQAIFVKKVQELTFPQNPMLFGADLRRSRRLRKLNSCANTSQNHTIETMSKQIGAEQPSSQISNNKSGFFGGATNAELEVSI